MPSLSRIRITRIEIDFPVERDELLYEALKTLFPFAGHSRTENADVKFLQPVNWTKNEVGAEIHYTQN